MLISCKKTNQKSIMLKQNLNFVQENQLKPKHAEVKCCFRARKQSKTKNAEAKCCFRARNLTKSNYVDIKMFIKYAPF